MRTFLTFILTCLSLLAANPPIVLNPWTTNQAPPVAGTNLAVRNPASGMQWLFYADPNSNRVARLWDITNMAPSLGTNFPGIRVSNTAYFSNTYAAGSNYMAGTLTESNIHGLTWTNWTAPYPPGITFSAGGIDLSSQGEDIPFRFYHHGAVSFYLDGANNEWVVTNDALHINSSLLIDGSVTNTGGIYYGDGSGLTNVPCTNATTFVGVALSNTVSQVAFEMTNVIPLLTNHWYYFTNVAWTNHTLKFTNLTAGTETRIYVKGGETNYTLNCLWPDDVVATWLSTTNDSMRSNRVTHINVSCWDATNVVLVGKEAP